jgi:hypothetical protein
VNATLLGALLLAVSLVSVVIYMSALGQLLIGTRRPGLVRTAVCRLFAALLYVGVGLTTLQTSQNGPLIGLGVFTVVQLMWQANSVADVRLARQARGDRMPDPHFDPPGVTDPVANYAVPLPPAVVAAEIDRLSEKMNKITRRFDKKQEDEAGERATHQLWRGIVVFAVILGICGLIFSLVVFGRADRADALAQQNAQLIAQMRLTQDRLNLSVHENCVLYGILLSTYSTRAKAASPGGPETYDSDFRRALASSDHLGCNLTPPPGLPS